MLHVDSSCTVIIRPRAGIDVISKVIVVDVTLDDVLFLVDVTTADVLLCVVVTLAAVLFVF